MNRRETLLGAAALAACGPAGSQPTAAPFPMRRGINLGNALEAPREGDWGYRIEDDHLRAIADAGFDGVRLPVRWDAHANERGVVQPDFLARVAAIVDQALALGLHIQLDCHHYDALIADPRAERSRFLNIWRSIAERFAGAVPLLLFEPLNEPNGPRWGHEALRAMQRAVIDVIRESNPNRSIVLGPNDWQSINALGPWRPPEAENIVVSVHYYEPHPFTHQRAEWLGDDAPEFDRAWGTGQDLAVIGVDMASAAAWGSSNNYALQLGEFGANRAVSIPQRAAWTRAVREFCEFRNMGWCAWDFAGAFPIWDRDAGAFIPEMIEALLGQGLVYTRPRDQ